MAIGFYKKARHLSETIDRVKSGGKGLHMIGVASKKERDSLARRLRYAGINVKVRHKGGRYVVFASKLKSRLTEKKLKKVM